MLLCVPARSSTTRAASACACPLAWRRSGRSCAPTCVPAGSRVRRSPPERPSPSSRAPAAVAQPRKRGGDASQCTLGGLAGCSPGHDAGETTLLRSVLARSGPGGGLLVNHGRRRALRAVRADRRRGVRGARRAAQRRARAALRRANRSDRGCPGPGSPDTSVVLVDREERWARLRRRESSLQRRGHEDVSEELWIRGRYAALHRRLGS